MNISEEIITSLKNIGVNFFVTYPCAKIRHLYNLTHSNFPSVPIAKEEEGVGICAGAALAGAKPAMLIQSTGLGNMVNALCSLTMTYQFPLLILASWRGVYHEKIAAQIPLGTRLPQIIEAMEIPYHIIRQKNDLPNLTRAATAAYERNEIHIVLLSPQLWENKVPKEKPPQITKFSGIKVREETLPINMKRVFTRFELLQKLTSFLADKSVICNIGLPSRELYQVKHQPSNFYMLGSLGLASSIGLGVALSSSNQVIVIDGDGSLLSNLGTLATIAQENPANLTILAIDNSVHGSTGNQTTATNKTVDLALAAKGLGIKRTYRATTQDELLSILSKLSGGPNFIHIPTRPGNMSVPAIPLTPFEIRDGFMTKIMPSQP
ncbi:MAG: sulfopyruvate decarboxylase subunit alpha [Candidatus Thorarchaeota archaeon]